MHDKGWEVIIDWQAGYSGPQMTPELTQQWMQASNECAEAAGYFDPQLTTAQIEELYSQEVENHECLVGIGVASDEPPSKQTFLDTFGSGEQYSAIRQAAMAQLPASEMRRIAETCVPPTWFLNLKGL